jgi:hypothetical protein
LAHAGAALPTVPATRGKAGGAADADSADLLLDGVEALAAGATNLGATLAENAAVLGVGATRGGAERSLAVLATVLVELETGLATARDATAARAASMSPMSTRPR